MGELTAARPFSFGLRHEHVGSNDLDPVQASFDRVLRLPLRSRVAVGWLLVVYGWRPLFALPITAVGLVAWRWQLPS